MLKIDQKFLSKGQKQIPGIYGGMGPMAHIYFEELLVEECKKLGVIDDQNYPVWILLNGSSTPDRTQNLDNTFAENYLKYFSKHLERSGADFIIMTCNTAHAYCENIQEELGIPIISIIEETSSFIKNNAKSHEVIGLMATTGTLKSHLYQKSLSQKGIKVITPPIDSDIQRDIMEAIYNSKYGIKSTGITVSKMATKKLEKAMKWLQKNGATSIIAGCTEISFAFKGKHYRDLDIIDPLNIIAKKTISLAYSSDLTIRVKDTTSVDSVATNNSIYTDRPFLN